MRIGLAGWKGFESEDGVFDGQWFETPAYLVQMTAPAGASADAAVAAAAHKILTYLYPGQMTALDARYATALAAIASRNAPAFAGGLIGILEIFFAEKQRGKPLVACAFQI